MRSEHWYLRLALGLAVLPLTVGGCFGSGSNSNNTGSSTRGSTTAPAQRSSDAMRKYSLDSLPTATITVNGNALRVWLAQDFDTARPDAVQEGLMFVPTEEIADDQGMLFVFSDEQMRGFWMKNTIAPLDIAYARMNGTIVQIWQMPPLTLRTFSSIEPAMFALEVKQGTFERLGIKEGDQIVIPADVFKASP